MPTGRAKRLSPEDDLAIEKLRRTFEHKDFEMRYALECFISQCSHILEGKLDQQLIDMLNSCKSDALTYKLLERLTEYLAAERRYRDVKGLLDYLRYDLETSFDIAVESENKQLHLIKRAVGIIHSNL